MVLPYIKMNPPQVYMCSPSWTFLPPPSPYHPSGSSQCTSPKHPVSCIEPGLATRFLHDILHVSLSFSQIVPPSPSPPESIRLFYTSVSLLLSRTLGYCYHLSTVLRKKCIFIIYIYTHTHTHIDNKIFMILNISSSIGLFFLYLLSWFLLSHLHLPWLHLRTQSQYEKILNDMFCCKSDVKTTWQEATSPWCRSYNAKANASCELLKKTSSE